MEFWLPWQTPSKPPIELKFGVGVAAAQGGKFFSGLDQYGKQTDPSAQVSDVKVRRIKNTHQFVL